MLPGNFGTATYPGIQAYASFEFTDSHGVQPGTGVMKVFPQYGFPAQDGDIVLGYNGVTITLKNCHIDAVDFESGSGGQIASVKFIDERWAWKDREITGKYNYRLPNNWVDPAHEKTPQQLASLCFQALGVTSFNVDNLPNDARPESDWDHASPSQELDKLCNDLGCRVVPIRSDGSWKICVTGEGAEIPDDPPYEDPGEGLDPQETPDYIKIVTAPIRNQVFLPLSPRGKDLDLSFKPIKELSYAPNEKLESAGFSDPAGFQDLAKKKVLRPDGTTGYGTERYTLPDGTKVSPQELARDTVFRCWGLDFTNLRGAKQANGTWFMKIAGVKDPVTVPQILMSDKLVQTFTDSLGAQHQRPAFVQGSFFGNRAPSGNYPEGTRIDKQWGRSDESNDERASFSLSLDPIDTYRSIITTSSPMLLFYGFTAGENFLPAKLKFCCAVNVRDPTTWQPMRYEYLHQIGSGTNETFCRTVIKDDIQPWTIQTTDASLDFTSNLGEVQQQCLYYAESIAREYTTVTTKRRTYIGLAPIDMDGKIQQVTYSIGPQGTSTQASQGSEHSWITPPYEERRQQVARQGLAGKVQYAKYETARREALKGSFNT